MGKQHIDGKALTDILLERHRQIHDEGQAAARDHQLIGELSAAAACYCIAAHVKEAKHDLPELLNDAFLKALWPWDWSRFSPQDTRHNLVYAAALIVTEIERLDKASSSTSESP